MEKAVDSPQPAGETYVVTPVNFQGESDSLSLKMEKAVESAQPAGETCVVTPDNFQGESDSLSFRKEKAVESGQPAVETCVVTPDNFQAPDNLRGFESLLAATMSSKEEASTTYYIDFPDPDLLGFIPTYDTAPGPHPPIVSSLKSFRELAKFADMIGDEFGTMANLPCGLVVEDFIGNTLFGQLYRGKIIQQQGLDNIQRANVVVKAWNYLMGEVRSFADPSSRFWRQIAKGRFYDEMKLLTTASPTLSSHHNMVKLIGSGLVNGRLAAVYEVDALDTLRNLLPRDDFDWSARIKVAIEFASLLDAFHSQDLKLRNICADNLVLDKDSHLKLVDFGMLFGGDFGDIPPFEKVWGCTGYVDPYFCNSGNFLDKSDVFSYGVLLLELVTKRAAVEEHFLLHVWARGQYEIRPNKVRRLSECPLLARVVVHESFRGCKSFYAKDGAAIIKLALRCVSHNLDKRPTIKEVVKLLRQLKVAKEIMGSDLDQQPTIKQVVRHWRRSVRLT